MELRKFINETIRDFFGENEINDERNSKLVKDLMENIKSRYPVDLSLHYNKSAHIIILSKILLDKKNRNSGFGTNIMHEICNFADKYNLNIALTPSSDFGGSKSRLIEFYKSFGFKKYDGYEFMETMIRTPH